MVNKERQKLEEARTMDMERQKKVGQRRAVDMKVRKDSWSGGHAAKGNSSTSSVRRSSGKKKRWASSVWMKASELQSLPVVAIHSHEFPLTPGPLTY